jgi:hypothetical protein
MNELKGKQGLKQESLIHFHRASLHTAFPFGKPQALTTNLRDYLTSSGRSRGLPLFSNLQHWWWSNTTEVEYYYSVDDLQMASEIMSSWRMCEWSGLKRALLVFSVWNEV